MKLESERRCVHISWLRMRVRSFCGPSESVGLGKRRERLPDRGEMLRGSDLSVMQKRRDGRGSEGRSKVKKEKNLESWVHCISKPQERTGVG